ncbi:hypothetical protein HYALB_00007455 [Hymenoscyphus albidus]|uniref:Cytochrome P450 n=1 Tax=Hymenoscyphus albidus TaxID=595503 RepID=A0A9N9QDA0_9HELO|nr:hypothetical protein HYALB_00007455 [Hymenoscyphus albidus]
MPWSNLLPFVGVLVGTSLFCVIRVTYRHRSHINDLRKQGFPMPKNWSWITGHILVLYKYQKKFPPLANVALATQELCRKLPDTEMFLLDLWSAFPASLMVFDPEAAVLVSQKYNLPKSDASLELLKPIVGGQSLLSMNGMEWKTWRARLNPGFNPTTLMQHVPYIVDCMDVFCEKLR